MGHKNAGGILGGSNSVEPLDICKKITTISYPKGFSGAGAGGSPPGPAGILALRAKRGAGFARPEAACGGRPAGPHRVLGGGCNRRKIRECERSVCKCTESGFGSCGGSGG